VSVGVGRVLGEINDRTGGALDKLEELGGFREDDPNTPIVYDENGKYVSGNESQSVGSIVRDLVQQGVSDQLATGEINEKTYGGHNLVCGCYHASSVRPRRGLCRRQERSV